MRGNNEQEKKLDLLLLPVMVLTLAFLFTQIKYIEPLTFYSKNKEILEVSVQQLQSVFNSIGIVDDNLPHEDASSLKVSCALYDEINVTVYQFQKGSESGYNSELTPAYGYNYVE